MVRFQFYYHIFLETQDDERGGKSKVLLATVDLGITGNFTSFPLCITSSTLCSRSTRLSVPWGLRRRLRSINSLSSPFSCSSLHQTNSGLLPDSGKSELNRTRLPFSESHRPQEESSFPGLSESPCASVSLSLGRVWDRPGSSHCRPGQPPSSRGPEQPARPPPRRARLI